MDPFLFALISSKWRRPVLHTSGPPHKGFLEDGHCRAHIVFLPASWVTLLKKCLYHVHSWQTSAGSEDFWRHGVSRSKAESCFLPQFVTRTYCYYVLTCTCLHTGSMWKGSRYAMYAVWCPFASLWDNQPFFPNFPKWRSSILFIPRATAEQNVRGSPAGTVEHFILRSDERAQDVQKDHLRNHSVAWYWCWCMAGGTMGQKGQKFRKC